MLISFFVRQSHSCTKMDDCDLCLLVQISLCKIFLTKSLQCKEWGFLLKELFGRSLGTGDYGHLLIDHAYEMLLFHE